MLTIRKIKEEYITTLGSDKEWLVTFRHNVPVILNNFSKEEFSLSLLPGTTSYKKLKEYKVRQLYNLPHTPRVILLPNEKNEREAHLLLGQKAPFNFEKLLSYQKDIKEMAHLFLKITSITEMLIKKYGYFRLTEKMIKAAKGFILIVWFNENQIENVPQFPYNAHMSTLNEECRSQLDNEVIQQIICLFQKYSNCEMWNRLKTHQKLNFSQVDQSVHQAMTETIEYIRRMSQVPKRLPLDENRQRYTNMPTFLNNNKSEYSHSKCSQHNRSICYQNRKMNQVTFAQKTVIQQDYHKFLNANRNQTYFTPNQKKGIADNHVPVSKYKLASVKQRRVTDDNDIYINVFSPINREGPITQAVKASTQVGDARSLQEFKVNSKTKNMKKQHCQSRDQVAKEDRVRENREVDFKDSDFSLSTTQYFSVNSSGNRIRRNSNDSIVHNLTGCKPKLISTFGASTQKTDGSDFRKKLKQSQLLGEKASKIIEESSQNFLMSSPRRHSRVITQNRLSPQKIQTPDSEFEREVFNLFSSGVDEDESEQIQSIQGELNKLMQT